MVLLVSGAVVVSVVFTFSIGVLSAASCSCCFTVSLSSAASLLLRHGLMKQFSLYGGLVELWRSAYCTLMDERIVCIVIRRAMLRCFKQPISKLLGCLKNEESY